MASWLYFNKIWNVDRLLIFDTVNDNLFKDQMATLSVIGWQ